MRYVTLKTREGRHNLFSACERGGVVRMNGQMICERGHITGPTLWCGPNDDLHTLATKWWKAALRHQREA